MANDGEGGGQEVLAPVKAGILPGEFFYFADRIGEWIDINLLTLPTRDKQQKRMLSAEERMAELVELAERGAVKQRVYKSLVSRYRGQLEASEDMVEKILFLDGAEIGLALDLEQQTRRQEQELFGALSNVQPGQSPVYILEALNSARLANQKMFEYMVVNYQFNEADIEKYGAIVREHLDFVKAALDESGLSAADEIGRSEEFLQAGLNIDAYQYANRAKNILYAAS
jgi:hypothetical protein